MAVQNPRLDLAPNIVRYDHPDEPSLEHLLADMCGQAATITARLMTIAGIPVPPVPPDGEPPLAGRGGALLFARELSSLLNRIGEHSDQLQRALGSL